jgi:hypothetical protein
MHSYAVHTKSKSLYRDQHQQTLDLTDLFSLQPLSVQDVTFTFAISTHRWAVFNSFVLENVEQKLLPAEHEGRFC